MRQLRLFANQRNSGRYGQVLSARLLLIQKPAWLIDAKIYLEKVSWEKSFPWLLTGMADKHSSILDIGCGSGDLIKRMHAEGFSNVQGADPFIKETFTEAGVTVYKKYIQEITGSFDLIMLHHSFEHMDKPLEVFRQLYMLLSSTGWALIRIPVAGGYAWRKYGVDWVQLDAPRHFFLHTVKSIRLLVDQSKMNLHKVIYDSTQFQFTGSERYLRDIPMHSKERVFTPKEVIAFSNHARQLNAIHDGDMACFYLQKAEDTVSRFR